MVASGICARRTGTGLTCSTEGARETTTRLKSRLHASVLLQHADAVIKRRDRLAKNPKHVGKPNYFKKNSVSVGRKMGRVNVLGALMDKLTACKHMLTAF